MDQYRNVTVLGVDPGTTRMGFAVVSGTSQAMRLIASGVIGDARVSKTKRLRLLYTELQRVIGRYKPELISLERLFFSKNVKTALEVAEARGVILLTAEIADLKVYQCQPQDVKIALTSQGNASKQQVAAMTKYILKIDKLPRLDDESDAMAIAITGIVIGRGVVKRSDNER